MNTRRKTSGWIGEATAGVIKVPSQAPAAGIDMPVNPPGLTYGEVRTTLVQMARAITLQAQAIGFD